MKVVTGWAEAGSAALYYERTGSGPPVLIVQGGVSNAGGTPGLVEHLSRRHAVITYDRRGIARSAGVEPAPAGAVLAQHADDAASVLMAAAGEPARVIGASVGAVIGLHLTVRWPSAVSGLLAHEPPLPSLVSDPEREQGLDDVAARAARGDLVPAVQQMAALTEPDPMTEPGAAVAAPSPDLMSDLRYFFAHDFTAVRTEELPAQALVALRELREVGGPLVAVSGGERTRGRWEYECARVLSTVLDVPLRELPGGHNGLSSHPRTSGERIAEWIDEGAL
ncbi:alpha/beta hydrolase [Pseudonocardia kongjuensis]|uniref:Alpha/beta hydrolase n=1 Tax=Pseudonocardia kongjuensis TaxID=102227 RepID=A0ABN1YCE6_9PSEU